MYIVERNERRKEMIIEHTYYNENTDTDTEIDNSWTDRIVSRNTATRRVSSPCRGCGFESTDDTCPNCGYSEEG